MKRITIKRVEVLSLAKLTGTINAFFGLLVGLGFAGIFSFMPGAFEAAPRIIFGVGAIVFWPVAYGIMGFIGGAIAAFIFNIASPIVGGVSIHATEESVKEQPEVSPTDV